MAAAVPYLIVGAIGLIGQWLLGPKSRANDQAPSQMPSLNQALRGTPIYVTFGTNRVSAQVVWTKNWTATRQQGGGKGAAKGGGSGGSGAAKGGGSAGSGYLYGWDIIFNYGIVDQPCGIGKAWVGGDRVNQASVNGWASGFIGLPDEDAGTADLQATEVFYAPGYNTGDLRLETWPYYATQENGLTPAWPSTVWLGFNQLQLGQAPVVPQLSLELVPETASITEIADPEVLGNSPNPQSSDTPSMPYAKAEGVLYSLNVNNGTGFTLYDVEGGNTITLDNTTATADIVAFNGGSPSKMNAFVIPNTPYVYQTWLYDDLGTPVICYLVYEIDHVNQIVNHVGSAKYGYQGGFRKFYGPLIGVFQHPNGRVLLVHTGRSVDGNCYITWVPGPITIIGSGIDEVQDWTVDTFLIPDSFLAMGGDGGAPQVTIVPSSEDAAGVHVVAYYSKAQAEFYIANDEGNFLSDPGFAPANPNGFTVRWEYFGNSWFTRSVNDFWLNAGSSAVPFSDAGLDSTGATGTSGDDWKFGVYYQGFVLMTRSYSDTPYIFKIAVYRMNGEFIQEVTVECDSSEWSGLDNDQIYPHVDSGDIWLMIDRHTGLANGTRRHVHVAALSLSASDVTPPYIISRILTSPIFGFQTQSLFGFTITEDSIDEATYQIAHQKCIDDGILISVTYSNQDSVLAIFNDLLAVYGGTLAEHGGRIYFDVFSPEDEVERVIDNHHLISDAPGKPPVEVTRGAVQDGYNSVQYQYLDRLIDYKQNQVNLSDEVDIDVNGYRNKIYNSRFVMTGSLAMVVAERALWSNMYGRDNYDFKLGWKDADLRPGNQITLVDSFHPALAGGVKVVLNTVKELERGVFSVQATRVYNNHLTAQHGYTFTPSLDPGMDGLIETAKDMLRFGAYELPSEFQGANNFVYFGYNQASYIMGAQLYVSRDLGANYILTQDVQPHGISGRLAVPLVAREPGYVEKGVEIYLFPTSGFNVSTPEYVQDYTLDDATAAVRASGGSTIIVGSEAMAMEGLTLLAQNRYRVDKLYRGWGGTPISAQGSGSYWHQHTTGIFALPITPDDVGTKIYYKVVGYNFAGKAFNVSSVVPLDYTIRGLKWLPRHSTALGFLVQSAMAWAPTDKFHGSHLNVVSGGSNVSLTWADASNIDGFGSGGFGAGGFGHFDTEVTSPTWRIDIASRNGVGVSSFVVSTPFFDYSVEQNSADFGGFAKEVVYRVTPFNVKGDGPTTTVRSLNLFW